MTDLRTAAQQALEALEARAVNRYFEHLGETIAALKAALEQPEQEPVGDSYADLFNALQRIETAAVFLPSFKITHEGGLEAVVQNIVDAIAALEQPEQDTDCHAQGICQRSGYGIKQPEQEQAEQELKPLNGLTKEEALAWARGLRADSPEMEGMVKGALYTNPPRREWRSLSEKEIGDVFHAARNAKLGAANDNSRHRLSVVEIARAIEAALKEKNHE